MKLPIGSHSLLLFIIEYVLNMEIRDKGGHLAFSAILLDNSNSYIFLVPFKSANIFQNTFREGRVGGCRQIQAESHHH